MTSSTTTFDPAVPARPSAEGGVEAREFDFGPTICLHDLNWDEYETLLKLIGDRHVRVTYIDGHVEIMSPSYRHEIPSERFGLFVALLTKALRIPCVSVGTLTFKKKNLRRGFEGDKSFYLANVEGIRGKSEIDPAVDPPPDLVVEVEISSRLLDKLKVYAAVGVPEIWRFDGRELRILRLGPNGKYTATASSVAFPFLGAKEIQEWIARESPFETSSWLAEVENWIQTVVIPRYQQRDS